MAWIERSGDMGTPICDRERDPTAEIRPDKRS
jgi:hypothetical protein